MCGRFTLGKTADVLAQSVRLATVPDWQPRYNIAPTQRVPTMFCPAQAAERQFRLLRWGLVPSWAKDLTIGAKLINARAETVSEKPSFRAAFKQQRCLVLADGFYEWRRLSRKKQPYYFQLQDGELFAFAGLWERWQRNGDTIESCTIVTTQANQLVASVHDRMPVMLAAADYDVWLDPATPIDQLQALLHPYASEAMYCYPVSAIVNTPTRDDPSCIHPSEPIQPNEQGLEMNSA
jgi:putative SOS response-associated peptidase YedK